jgi:exopolysaccharide biosynthesis polyprenyl glycosylphosphotransferase
VIPQAKGAGARSGSEGIPDLSGLPLRLLLQQRQSRNVWAHLSRDALRVLVLAASDILAFVLLRGVVRGLRAGWLGTGAGDAVASYFPQGFLESWQFLGALLISLMIVGAYGAGDARRDSGRLFSGAALAVFVGLYGELWSQAFLVTLVRGMVVAGMFGLTLTFSRLIIDWIVWRVRPTIGVARALVVAHGDADWQDLSRLLKRARDFVVVGRVDLDKPVVPGLRAQLSELGSAIQSDRAEAVLLWGDLSNDEFAYVVDVALAAGCRVLAGARASVGEVERRGVWIGGRQLVELTPPVLRGWQHVVKRLTDFVGAGLGLALLSPLFILAAAAIVLDSGRPVFFRQQRIGRGGRRFRIFKFRSMAPDAERRLSDVQQHSVYEDSRLFKMPGDPRITRVGRFLRRTSIDEIPQLINVLLGDMSLVGPRPPLPAEVASYDPHHLRRFDVKPGITGPWQVGGRNGITDFDEVVRLESQYIREWSVMKDLRILMRTVPVVLSGRGAH